MSYCGSDSSVLGQPVASVVDVVTRPRGVDQPPWHAARFKGAGRRRWWRRIRAQTVDPGVHLIGIDVETGIQLGPGLGDAFGFPGETVQPLGFGLDVRRLGGVGVRRVHDVEHN